MKELVPGVKLPRRIKASLFRLHHSPEDPSVVVWRPYRLTEGEWPTILLMKLEPSKVSLLNKIDIIGDIQTIHGLEVTST